MIYLLRPASRRSQSGLTDHEETKMVALEEQTQSNNGEDKNDGVEQGSGGDDDGEGSSGLVQQQGQLQQEAVCYTKIV